MKAELFDNHKLTMTFEYDDIESLIQKVDDYLSERHPRGNFISTSLGLFGGDKFAELVNTQGLHICIGGVLRYSVIAVKDE